MKRLLKQNLDLALLLVRIGVGIGFLLHGLQKLQGLEGTVKFFGSLGLPSFMAYLVALIETVAGTLMLLGLYTEIAGYLLCCVMIGAIVLVKFKKGFIGGYELDMLYFMGSLAIAFAGPGKYAVKLPKKPGEAGKAPSAPVAPMMTGPAPKP